jgi:hypothetical protein
MVKSIGDISFSYNFLSLFLPDSVAKNYKILSILSIPNFPYFTMVVNLHSFLSLLLSCLLFDDCDSSELGLRSPPSFIYSLSPDFLAEFTTTGFTRPELFEPSPSSASFTVMKPLSLFATVYLALSPCVVRFCLLLFNFNL